MLIAGLIILGVGAVATGVGIGHYYATADERKIAELEAEKEQLKAQIDSFNKVKDKMYSNKKNTEKARDYLQEGKQYFLDGGHVNDGVPLASDEFRKISNVTLKVMNAANNVYNCLVTDISNMHRRIDAIVKEIASLKSK